MLIHDPVEKQVTVVWDVDDVLNNLTTVFLESLSLEPPNDRLGPWFDPKEFAVAAGVPAADYENLLDSFRKENYASLQPSPEILQWMQACQYPCRHQALTRAPLISASISASWMFENFGRWIRQIGVAPSRRPSDPPGMLYETKADAISRISGKVVMIDDTPRNFEGLDTRRVSSLAFPSPWGPSWAPATFLEKLDQLILEIFRERQ